MAGGGLKDEYDRDNPEMRELFGIAAARLNKADISLRPKLGLLHKKPLDTAGFKTGRVDCYGYKQDIEIKNSGGVNILARDGAGKPAAIENKYGKGKAILLGFLPGFAYVKPAFPLKPYGRSADLREELSGYIPRGFSAGVRQIFSGMLDDAGVSRPVTCSDPLVEATLLKGNDGVYRISLVNFNPGTG